MQPTEVYTLVGHRIRGAREALGLRQDELAAAVSLTRTSITNIERGKQRLLLHTLCEIAEALRIEPADLLPRLSDLLRVHDLRQPPSEDLSPGEWEWIRSLINTHEGA